VTPGSRRGSGAELVLACDVVVADGSPDFGFYFAKAGLAVDAGLGRALAHEFGRHRAQTFLLRGAAHGRRRRPDWADLARRAGCRLERHLWHPPEAPESQAA